MLNSLYILFMFLIMGLSISCFSEEMAPGDGVRLTFYNISQEISGDYFIHEDGTIQFPYIGIIKTKTKSYETIRLNIESKYDSLYRGVELIIQPLYRITLLGEVRNPGVYYVTGVEKLLDVIAVAGGETEDSDMSNIIVNRKNEEKSIDARDIILNDSNEEDFYLKSGDRIYISRKWWVTGRNTSFLFSAAAVIVAVVSIFVR